MLKSLPHILHKDLVRVYKTQNASKPVKEDTIEGSWPLKRRVWEEPPRAPTFTGSESLSLSLSSIARILWRKLFAVRVKCGWIFSFVGEMRELCSERQIYRISKLTVYSLLIVHVSTGESCFLFSILIFMTRYFIGLEHLHFIFACLFHFLNVNCKFA